MLDCQRSTYDKKICMFPVCISAAVSFTMSMPPLGMYHLKKVTFHDKHQLLTSM